jgi:hypothetical protein
MENPDLVRIMTELIAAMRNLGHNANPIPSSPSAVRYLGHEIDGNGLPALSSKVDAAIINVPPPPKDVGEVRERGVFIVQGQN